MVNSLSSTQMIWVRFPLSAFFAYLVKLVNTTDLKSVPSRVIGSSPIVSIVYLCKNIVPFMTTTTSILRVKTLRKLGASLWPWRKLNAKQTDLVDKSIKGQRKQVSLLQRKKKKSQFAYQLKAKQLLSTLYGNLNTKYFKTLFQKCKKIKGKQSVNFLTTLEKRLDCILYRASFAPSLQAAKQLITHKKVCVNQILFLNRDILLTWRYYFSCIKCFKISSTNNY